MKIFNFALILLGTFLTSCEEKEKSNLTSRIESRKIDSEAGKRLTAKMIKPNMTEQESKAFVCALAINLYNNYGETRMMQFSKEVDNWDETYFQTYHRNSSSTELCHQANTIYWRLNK